MVMSFGPRSSSGVLFPFRRTDVLSPCVRLEYERDLLRAQQQSQAPDIQPIHSCRICASELVSTADASHDSPGAIEQSQGRCGNYRMGTTAE